MSAAAEIKTSPSIGFMCPLWQCVMTDPVITTEGITYERAAIEQHFQQQRARGMFVFMTSPITDAILADTNLIPNAALKCVIDEWREQQHQQSGSAMALLSPPSPSPFHGTSSKHMFRIPTMAIGSVYHARKQLKIDFKVDIEIERDDLAQDLGVRVVKVPETSTMPPNLIRDRMWSIVQKQFNGKTAVFDPDNNGLPYKQIMFPIDSTNYKIGRLLSREEKLSIQKKFKVNFLVERHSPVHATRTVVLTAWNATVGLDKVSTALEVCKEYILSQLE